jgi:hypothetical protein
MATTSIDTWALDLADVTLIYPWVGTEAVMAVVAIVLWIGWHVWQIRTENAIYEEERQKHGKAETIEQVLNDG